MLRSFQAVLIGFLVLAVEKISADTCTLYPIADTYIDESSPDSNYGNTYLCAGNQGGTGGWPVDTMAFLAFNTIGTIPADAVITSL
jgi:hypothetical protein